MNLHTHCLREPRLQRGAIPFRSSYRLNNLLPLLQRFCERTASACCMQCWRRRSDSNGWCLFKGHSALAVRCLRPLGHVSLKSLVGMERIELSRAKALVSKTSVSPISTTSPQLSYCTNLDTQQVTEFISTNSSVNGGPPGSRTLKMAQLLRLPRLPIPPEAREKEKPLEFSRGFGDSVD